MALITAGSITSGYSDRSSSEVFGLDGNCFVPPLPSSRARHSTFLTMLDEVITCGPTYECLLFSLKNFKWETVKVGNTIKARDGAMEVSMPNGVYLISGGREQNSELLRSGRHV